MLLTYHEVSFDCVDIVENVVIKKITNIIIKLESIILLLYQEDRISSPGFNRVKEILEILLLFHKL